MLIIAVSGVTNSGKTTLAKALQNALPKSVLISQDTYFLPKESNNHVLIPELNHLNWEIMSSLDMDKMWEDINYILKKGRPQKKCCKETTNSQNANNSSLLHKCNSDLSVLQGVNPDLLNQAQVLIIEGFLILNDKRIADISHLKYHLTLSREECYKRRIAREYDPPDVPGYFDACVWPEYIKHKEEMLKEVQNVKIIDGSQDIHTILNEVLGDIVDKLKSLSTS